MTGDDSRGAPAVHVWTANLADEGPANNDSADLLSDGERARVQRAGSVFAGERYTRRRGFIREVLAEFTRTDPRSLVLETTCRRCGKLHPSAVPHGDATAWWSASSSGDTLVLAVAAWPVGVDVEEPEAHGDWPRIARRYFADGEAEWIGEDAHRFVQAWTLKEAFLKGRGVGLAGGLDSIDCARLVEEPDGWWRTCEHAEWAFCTIPGPASTSIAIAVRGATSPLSLELRPEEAWPALQPSSGRPVLEEVKTS